jgi:hypothetical protein
MADTEITATELGPVFDVSLFIRVEQFETDLLDAVGDKVAELVRLHGDRCFKNPTGHYNSQVKSRTTETFERTVSDGGVAYGAWLEGVSERNATSRFKGYAMYAEEAANAQQNIQMIIDFELSRMLSSANGTT